MRDNTTQYNYDVNEGGNAPRPAPRVKANMVPREATTMLGYTEGMGDRNDEVLSRGDITCKHGVIVCANPMCLPGVRNVTLEVKEGDKFLAIANCLAGVDRGQIVVVRSVAGQDRTRLVFNATNSFRYEIWKNDDARSGLQAYLPIEVSTELKCINIQDAVGLTRDKIYTAVAVYGENNDIVDVVDNTGKVASYHRWRFVVMPSRRKKRDFGKVA